MDETPQSQPPILGNPAPAPTPTPKPAPAPAPPSGDAQARQWNMFCHLAALAGFVFPFGNILGPLIVWQIKKNEIPSVDEHGRAALNFQITVAIATLACAILGFIGMFLCFVGIIFFFAAMAIWLGAVVLAIMAGIKANNGETYKYPFSLKIV